ncbi:MAG: hypothetical protein F6K31_32330 [Symploca sp. SIO2G7]|nr:hypothetical protein [Symploca sp. SIO2G7]
MAKAELTKWTAEYYNCAQIGADKLGATEPEWKVAADGHSVTQDKDASPSFFYSNFSTFSHIISAKLDVEASADDDFVGFALNFQPGDTGNDNADFLLLTWNAQPKRAGLKLCRVNGIPQYRDFLHLPEVAIAQNLGSTPWEHQQIYQFKFNCNSNKIQIWVDDSLEFDIDGKFEDGRFACFDCSQAAAVFSDIEAQMNSSMPLMNWNIPSEYKLRRIKVSYYYEPGTKVSYYYYP